MSLCVCKGQRQRHKSVHWNFALLSSCVAIREMRVRLSHCTSTSSIPSTAYQDPCFNSKVNFYTQKCYRIILGYILSYQTISKQHIITFIGLQPDATRFSPNLTTDWFFKNRVHKYFNLNSSDLQQNISVGRAIR